MGRNRTLFDESLFMNDYTYRNYFRILLNLALSRFEYKNLPASCDVRTLELTLLTDAKACFVFDDVTEQLLTLPYTFQKGFDVYGNPKRIRAYSKYNNYQNESSKFVVCWNNYTHTNNISDLEMFAKRLYNLDRIIDVNCNAQKTPVLIKANEKQRLTMKNLYKEYDGNAPFIFGDKNLDINDITSISTDAPFVSDRIYQLKTQIFNECLTYLGITNISVQKKERMLVDEVNRTMGGTFANRFSFLDCRKNAVQRVNEMFNTNIEVSFNEEANNTAKNLVGGELNE